MPHPAEHIAEGFTYGDYEKWPDTERWELIEGVAYNMTPAPSTQHQRISGRLFVQIAVFLTGQKCEFFDAPFDVRLPTGGEDDADVDTVVQPDIAVICDPAKIDVKGCRGAPDFISEILSPSTASKDQIRKASLYEKHGVREYWIVHPIDGIVIIRTLGTDRKYTLPRFVEAIGPCPVTVLPGLEINLMGVFA